MDELFLRGFEKKIYIHLSVHQYFINKINRQDRRKNHKKLVTPQLVYSIFTRVLWSRHTRQKIVSKCYLFEVLKVTALHVFTWQWKEKKERPVWKQAGSTERHWKYWRKEMRRPRRASKFAVQIFQTAFQKFAFKYISK